MSISTAIQDAQNRVAAVYTKISEKGGTVPTEANLTNMPAAIDTISTGGGDEVVTIAMSTAKDFVEGDKVFLNKADEVFNDNVTANPNSVNVVSSTVTPSVTNHNPVGFISSSRMSCSGISQAIGSTFDETAMVGTRSSDGSSYSVSNFIIKRSTTSPECVVRALRVAPHKYISISGYQYGSGSAQWGKNSLIENDSVSFFPGTGVTSRPAPLKASHDGTIMMWPAKSSAKSFYTIRQLSDGTYEDSSSTVSNPSANTLYLCPAITSEGMHLLLGSDKVYKWPLGEKPTSTGTLTGLSNTAYILPLSPDATYVIDYTTGDIYHCTNGSTGERAYTLFKQDTVLQENAGDTSLWAQYFEGDYYIFAQQNWWKFNNGTLTRLQNIFSDADFDTTGMSDIRRGFFVNFDDNIALGSIAGVVNGVLTLRTAVKQLSVAPYEYASYSPDNFPIFDSTLTGYVKENQGVDVLGNTKLLVQTVLDPQHQPWSPEGKIFGFGTQVTAGSAETPVTVWTRPNLTSFNSYGVTSDTRNNPKDSESFWVAFDGSLSTFFVPSTRGSATFGKWVLPKTLRFKPSSVITWVHRNNGESFGSSVHCQFFADEAMTKPLGNTFIDPSSSNAEVEIPCSNLTEDLDTDTIYLHIPAGGGWGGAAEIKFAGVYAYKACVEGSVSVAKGYYQDSTVTLIGPAQTATLTALKTSQTAGWKNDLYMIGSTGTDAVPRICKVDTTVNKGSLTTALKLSTPVYLSLAKDYILSGPTEGLDVTFTSNSITVGTGYGYKDERIGYYTVDSAITKTPAELIVSGATYTNNTGYLYLTRSAEMLPKIISKISPIKNPTMQDIGGSMDPYDLKKTVTLSEDLTSIINVTDTQEAS